MSQRPRRVEQARKQPTRGRPTKAYRAAEVAMHEVFEVCGKYLNKRPQFVHFCISSADYSYGWIQGTLILAWILKTAQRRRESQRPFCTHGARGRVRGQFFRRVRMTDWLGCLLADGAIFGPSGVTPTPAFLHFSFSL